MLQSVKIDSKEHQMPKKKSFLSKLDPEIAINIFTYLDSKSLLSLASCNRYLSNLIDRQEKLWLDRIKLEVPERKLDQIAGLGVGERNGKHIKTVYLQQRIAAIEEKKRQQEQKERADQERIKINKRIERRDFVEDYFMDAAVYLEDPIIVAAVPLLIFAFLLTMLLYSLLDFEITYAFIPLYVMLFLLTLTFLSVILFMNEDIFGNGLKDRFQGPILGLMEFVKEEHQSFSMTHSYIVIIALLVDSFFVLLNLRLINNLSAEYWYVVWLPLYVSFFIIVILIPIEFYRTDEPDFNLKFALCVGLAVFFLPFLIPLSVKLIGDFNIRILYILIPFFIYTSLFVLGLCITYGLRIYDGDDICDDDVPIALVMIFELCCFVAWEVCLSLWGDGDIPLWPSWIPILASSIPLCCAGLYIGYDDLDNI